MTQKDFRKFLANYFSAKKITNDIWVDNPKNFITVNGQAVPVAKGQTKKEAGKNFVSEKNEESRKEKIKNIKTRYGVEWDEGTKSYRVFEPTRPSKTVAYEPENEVFSDSLFTVISKKPSKEANPALAEKENSKAKSLTKENKEAIEYYASGEGMYINQYLRDNKDLDSQSKKLVKDLDSSLDVPVKEKVLYRSVDASAVLGDMTPMEWESLQGAMIYNNKDKFSEKALEKAQKSIGKEYVEKGYMSTTRNPELAEEWRDFTGSTKPIVLKVNTSKTTKGRNISDISSKMKEIENTEPQEETLLARNQKYKVKNLYGKNGNIYVEVDMI